MKILNTITKATLCLIMIQLSLACSESKSKRSGVGIYRAPVKNVSESHADSAVATITGAVVASFGGNVSSDTFQRNVKAFSTAFMMPDDSEFGLGNVSHVYEEITDNSGTGIRLNLNICLAGGGKIKPNQSYYSNIARTSTPLTVYIKDSKVVTDPNTYSPLEISGYSVSGSISGKNISLLFENNLGKIKMIGDYSRSSEWFAGTISFENKVNFVENERPWKSNDGRFYSLGEFYIQMNSLSRNCN